ncbi:glycoside hydrolase family 13 protein [Herbidospora yilanensis]|uniref:glycoside hydrolase family 13 protein n=1 Tax=Herbidospora yilanensis TaxID=354426 RepID=UPI00078285EF|nr:glycoside hydrolase family 13 protein [Herbidospora yilanensis]
MTSPWWRDAVVYEIYVRSFADASGDGVGDLPGVTDRLPYLAELGVDAVWLTPFYRSPMADGGYDVADYRDVDPAFGTLADFDALMEKAHGLGLRVMIDIVPNHSSIEHPWFQEALRGVKRDRYLFRAETNNWQSVFGGPAWTRVADGSYYLHLFAPEQPDFNWRNPDVHAEFLDVLRFWLDRGVDGFRIDVANGLYKAEDLPDTTAGFVSGSPMSSRPEVHEVYREWRALIDTYPGERAFVSEVWTDTAEDLALYVRPDELHQSFNFAWLKAPWSADAFRAVIEKTLTEIAAPTWVLSNHDVVRHVTRYGEGSLTPSGGIDRAKAALLAMLALPGSAYLYQGEELGLPEVQEIPPDKRQDPTFFQTDGELPGRDGCRVPLPWSGSASPYGFGTGEPWLPQPSSWALLSAERQAADPASTLSFYKAALAWRKRIMSGDEVEWLAGPPDTLFFRRGPVICAVNCGDVPVPLPGHKELVLATTPLVDDLLPADGGAWLLA